MRPAVQYILGLLLTLGLAEFVELAPWISERLLGWAARWLPPKERQRYQDDWLGELDAIPGKITKLVFTFNVLIRVPGTHRALTGRDAIWVLLAKRLLALLIAGLLMVLQSLIRVTLGLPSRRRSRTESYLEERVVAAAATTTAEVRQYQAAAYRAYKAVPRRLPVAQTSLPRRTVRSLERVGITTMGQLGERLVKGGGEAGLLGSIRNFGRQDMDAVRRLMSETFIIGEDS